MESLILYSWVRIEKVQGHYDDVGNHKNEEEGLDDAVLFWTVAGADLRVLEFGILVVAEFAQGVNRPSNILRPISPELDSLLILKMNVDVICNLVYSSCALDCVSLNFGDLTCRSLSNEFVETKLALYDSDFVN